MPQFLNHETYGTGVNVVSPNLTGTPVAPTAASGTSTTQIATTAFVQNAIQMGHGICNGRLTIASGDPVGTYSGTGGNVYFTPYLGNMIGLYDGSTTWNILPFTEKGLVVPGGGGLYDVFAYNNGGVVAIEVGNAWTSTGNQTGIAGVRNQTLVLQDGVLVKSGATTRRYLGTFWSSGVATDSIALRLLWNYYNRVEKKVALIMGSVSWNYTTNSTWRPFNGNAGNSIAVVCGQQESFIKLRSSANLQAPDANNSGLVGIGYDTYAVNSADLDGPTGFVAAFRDNSWASIEHLTMIGYHTYFAIEEVINVAGAIAMNFYSSGPSSYSSCGISGTYWC